MTYSDVQDLLKEYIEARLAYQRADEKLEPWQDEQELDRQEDSS